MAKYYTVLVRDSKDAAWGIHFGDYDKEVAHDERDDVKDEFGAGNVKVICTAEDQDSINVEVAAQNVRFAQ